MDGQGLFVAIATMFGGAFLSHPGRYEKRQWLLLIGTAVFAVVAGLWPTLNLGALTQSINSIASNGWVWLGMIAITWIYLAFITHPRPLVEIITPKMGQKVNREESVSGLVSPRDTAIQLFILSGDNYWYPVQARTDGAAWGVTAKIGAKESPANSHKLVAISGAPKITEKVLKLPRGHAKSRIITVYRITNNP